MAVQASLVYTAPDGSKKDLMLHVGEDTTIGRHPNCSLTISQPSVSRRHARLWFDQGVWFVEDLQSSNGTFVNNRRINRAQLTEGDELRCGDFLLTYGVAERTRAVPTPERREKLPPAPPSPQVSNRATVGLDSPPPIPEAPRLSAPRPATPPAAPAIPSAPPSPSFSESAGREEELSAELAKAKETEADLRSKLDECRAQLEDALEVQATGKEEVVQVRNALDSATQERDAAIRDVERLEEQKARLEEEINELSAENRELVTNVEATREELAALRADGEQINESASARNAEQDAELERLQNELSTKDNEVRSLQQELEQIQAGVSTMATSTAVPSEEGSKEANEALSTHSSELRVALKAASGFVQEVKDVFSSVAAMKPTGKAAKSVLEVQDAFEENGGMDPVTSLEVAFDKMEQTARQLRRLSKGR